MRLDEFRKSYPQYNDISDKELADKLYDKFYTSDFSREEYYAKVGYTPAEPLAQPEPITGTESAFATAPITPAPTPSRRASVMEGFKPEPTAPIETRGAPVSQKEYDRIRSMYDMATPQQREALAKRTDYVGNVVRALDAEYGRFKSTAPSAKRLDPRIEARAEEHIRRGADYRVAQLRAKQEVELGLPPTPLTVAEEPSPEAVEALETRKEGIAGRALTRAKKGFIGGGAGFLQAIADFTGDEKAAERLGQVADKSEEFLQQLGDPKSRSPLVDQFELMLGSLAQQGPGLLASFFTGTTLPVLANIGVTTFGQAYSEGKREGQSASESALRASLLTGAEIYFSRFGLSEQIAGMRAAAKGVRTDELADFLGNYFGKAIAKEVPAEMATTAAQFGIEKLPIGLRQEGTAADLIKQLSDTVLQTVLQTGTIGGVAGAAALAKSGARRAIDKLGEGERDVIIPPGQRPSRTLGGESIPVSGRPERTLAPEGATETQQPSVGVPTPTPPAPVPGEGGPPPALDARKQITDLLDEYATIDPVAADEFRKLFADPNATYTQDDVDIVRETVDNARKLKEEETPSATEATETVKTEEEGAAASAEGTEVAEPTAAAKTADQLQDEIRDLEQQRLALLTKNGRVPAVRSKARAKYDALGEQIAALMDQWAEADRAERNAKAAKTTKPVEGPTERQQRIAFGKALGATYGESLRYRQNQKAANAVVKQDFKGVLAALLESKNPIIREVARLASNLSTKIKLEKGAFESVETESTIMRQLSIDSAKMHLNALDYIRSIAPQIENLPDGAALPYETVSGYQLQAFEKGEPVSNFGLNTLVNNKHSMFAPLNLAANARLNTKEDFLKLRDAMEAATTELGEANLRMTASASAYRQSIAGAYDAATNTIKIAESAEDGTYYAKNENLLAHEIVHAQASNAVANPTKEQKPIVDRLNNLYQYVKQHYKKVQEQEDSEYYRPPYGVASIQEFLAEGVGNTNFQYELSRIKYQNTNAWSKFVEYIANLLGLKNDNALTELLTIYSELAGQQDVQQELVEAAKTAETTKPTEAPPAERTFGQVLQEKNDLIAERQKLLTPKGKPPAVRSLARRKYDALTERINQLHDEELKLTPSEPVKTEEATVKDLQERVASLKKSVEEADKELDDAYKAEDKFYAENILKKSSPTNKVYEEYDKFGEKVTELEEKLDKLEKELKDAQLDLREKIEAKREEGSDFFDIAKTTGTTADSTTAPVSLRRTVRRLRKSLNEGTIDSDTYATEVNEAYEATSKERQEPKDLVRGELYFRERLLRAVRNQEIPQEAADLAMWFISQNPALIDDLAISVRQPGQQGNVAGQYLPLPRIARFIAGSVSNSTVVHEILHHLERMMPEKVQSALRELWLKSLIDRMRRTPYNTPQRKFLETVHKAFLYNDKKAYNEAYEMLSKGQVPYELYQYFNPSEFWAVNGSRIVQNRYNIANSVIARLKQWLKDLAAKIKDYFGLPSDAPILRALDSLAKADGKFQTKTMLAKDVERFYATSGPPPTPPGQKPQFPKPSPPGVSPTTGVPFNQPLPTPPGQQPPTPPGKKKRVAPARGPISGKSKWRTVEDVSKSLGSIIGDALKRRVPFAKAMGELGPALWNPANGKLRRAFLFAATLRQLADITRTKFPQLTTAINIVDKMTSYRLSKLKEAQTIALDWLNAQNKKPEQSTLVGRIMLDATINGKDPDKGPTTPELDAAWASLDPEFKAIYRKVRDYFYNNLQEMIREMKKRVLKLPKAERQEAIRKINEQFAPDKLVFPYFPLRRFGEYWFQVGKGANKEFYEFESEISRELSRRARIRELQAGNAKQKALAETVEAGSGISELFSKNLASTQILKEVQELIDSIVPPTGAAATKTAEDVRDELKDSLNQLIYIMLPQQSMRKMFINRKAIQGASSDMLRVFTDVAVHNAYQMARFKYSEDFINNINKAREYVKEFFKPDTREVYRDYINELEARTKTILSAEDKSLLAKAAGTAGSIVFFTMLSAPFTALLNTVGFAVFAGSKLGGKYGYTKASEVMLKNMGRYWQTAPGRTLKPAAKGLFFEMQFPSIVESGNLSPLLKRAADRFISEEQVNISLTNDIFDLSDRPSELYTTRYNVIKKILGGLFHQSERANREVALMSAFELEYDRLLNEPKRDTRGAIERDANGNPVTYTPDEAFEAAIEEAKHIAGLTLGDFSRQMKSRLFANVPLSVILKFKQYAVMATYNWVRALQLGLRPYSKKELGEIREFYAKQNMSQAEIDRRMDEIEDFRSDIGSQARKELAGILGVTFLFGGLEAMPFFWIVMPIMAAMLASDDEKDDELFDYLNWFRRWASEWMGGMSFARGAVSQVVEGSISERVSLDPKNLFYRDGRYSPDIVEGLIQDVIANAGPVVGLGLNWAEAVKLFNEGQYQRAWEKILPAFFAKPMQAYRYGTEGAVTKSGETQIAPEDFSGWMLAMQAIGLQPEELALKQKRAIQAKEADLTIKAKETAILNRLWLERDSDEGYEAALDKAIDFYGKNPELLPKSGSLAEKIQNSFEKRAEDIAQAEAVGARIDKRLIGRIGQMLETGKKEPAPSKQMTLEEVRKRYPEYDDIPDDELTAALKKKGILK